MKHIQTLPPHARESAPVKIHYHKMAPPKKPDDDEEDDFDARSDAESVDSELGRLLGREQAGLSAPVSDQFQTCFRPVSDAGFKSVPCRICGVHVTVSSM